MTAGRPPLPDSYEGIHNSARNAFRSGDSEQALALYRRLTGRLGRLSDRVLARRPELRDLHLQASGEYVDLLRLAGRYAEAIEVMGTLIESHPDQADTWRRGVAILRNVKGDSHQGMAELRALAEEQPDEVLNWLVLGGEARIEGRFQESQSAIQRGLELAKDGGDAETLAEVHYQHFLLLQDMGRTDDAVAAWEEALDAHPSVIDSINKVYTMLTEAGRYSQAQGLVARDNNELRSGFQRGLIASLTGKDGLARQEWKAVANLDPAEHESGHEAWVEAVLRLGDPEPALLVLQDLLNRHVSPRLLCLSGIAWAMRGDRELATALFQQAINLLRRERPPKQKLPSADWRLLDSLVSDKEIKAACKPYFVVLATLWG
jgi:tetratricopeptide (TPR) repeat protein